ncbi:MAG: BlaI/MecI/CopY family transcriptional regulator [Planctomycetes bacterium]|nr:BlaI/MecI/CopY family transcriptional regulator [Planctomycetota bacterium]
MSRHHLTRCELEIMNVVWDRGRVTVQDVVDALDRPLAYTTVMTMLNILFKKRIVARCGKRGRAYVYKPLVSREQVRRSMTSELTDALFDGSVKSLVLSLIDAKSLSRSDVEELKKAIESVEAQS